MEEIKVTLGDAPTIEASFASATVSYDPSSAVHHSDLTERAFPDQHPISAITGLEDALESIITQNTLDLAVEDAVKTILDSGELKGEKGEKGDTGEQGVQGMQGIPGEKGDKGDTGAQGPQGEKGDKGDTGAQGPQGEKGDKGDSGAQGPQGEKGAKGDTGADGASITITNIKESSLEGGTNTVTFSDGSTLNIKNGSAGAGGGIDADQLNTAVEEALQNAKDSGEFDGSDGVSATHSWNGTTLTVTSASGTSSADLKGEKGDKGDKGDTGAQGIQGSQGEKGDKGDTGATGADGKTPVKGTDYYTEADKAEMVDLVLAALPTWNGGSY